MPRSLLMIIILAFFLRMLMLGGILVSSGEQGLFKNDSQGFYRTASNILAGNGFSREIAPPYAPSAHFPPVYPLLLAASIKISHSVIPLVLFQIVLSSLIPFLVWKIGEFLTQEKKALAIAAGLAAFEPMMMLWSVLVLTEVIAIFSLLLAVLFFLKTLEDPLSSTYILLSGFFLGLSTLTRPHAQFLFILGFLFLIATLFLQKRRLKEFVSETIIRRDGTVSPQANVTANAERAPSLDGASRVLETNSRSRMLKISLIFAFAFFATLSPWLTRNYYQFHTFNIATTGARNIYTSLGTSIISFEKNITYEEAQEFLDNQFREKYNADPKEIRENPAWGPSLAKDGIQLIREYPKSTIQVLLITLNSFFTQDLYVTEAKQFGLIPNIPFGFSPSVLLVKDGPVALAKIVWEKLGIYSLIPVLGRMLWIMLTLLCIIGFWKAWKEKRRTRFIALIFLVIILYYASTSIAAGFSDHGRHRYPANSFIFILAAYGVTQLLITKRFSRRLQPDYDRS